MKLSERLGRVDIKSALISLGRRARRLLEDARDPRKGNVRVVDGPVTRAEKARIMFMAGLVGASVPVLGFTGDLLLSFLVAVVITIPLRYYIRRWYAGDFDG